ncbi:MAG: DUF4139 domain-containing protein [Acidobacteriaceae bacterium]|jgi:hypothetical protein
MSKLHLALLFAAAGTLAATAVFAPNALAQQGGAAPVALTIYNQNFAVVRTTVDLDLKAGANQVTTTNVTSQLEPDSVVLRDPAGKVAFKVTEQNYDAGVIDQNSLLAKFEGKTIQFQRGTGADGKPITIDGKIIRAGVNMQPMIEADGLIQFQYPGTPLFPAATDGLLLKPTLRWQIDAPRAAHLPAELAYITNGMSWQATYNVVAPESSDVTGPEHVDLFGWVTMQNNSGTDFPEARIKLMAGDVAKIQNMNPNIAMRGYAMASMNASSDTVSVTQQAFDDFHLYDLNRTVSLSAGETKQVEFLEANQVQMDRVYQYDGATPQPGYNNVCIGCHNDQPSFGVASNTKVTVRAEIKNSTANRLGMPLPAGRIRLYRRDADGQMEFIGEGSITHTPAEETVKVPIGNAFDVTGERKQTDFHTNQSARTTDESFEITVKNQKTTPVNVAVVEHMNRAQNWEITEQSTKFTRKDSTTLEFPIAVPAAGENKVTYSVRYTW